MILEENERLRCPKCGGKTFNATAHVTQDWELDEFGVFRRSLNDCIEVTHEPDRDDIWDCPKCGFSGAGIKFITSDPPWGAEEKQMAIYSLNDAHKSKEFLYMCNTCGEISRPEANLFDLWLHRPEDVMTKQERVLYENYWQEGRGCNEYILRIGEKAAMGLGFLADKTWCQELAERMTHITVVDSDVEAIWMPRLLLAINEAAEKTIQPAVPECDIYIGDRTDPDGHEILVVVPYHLREQVADIVKKLNGIVYPAIEEAFDRGQEPEGEEDEP